MAAPKNNGKSADEINVFPSNEGRIVQRQGTRYFDTNMVPTGKLDYINNAVNSDVTGAGSQTVVPNGGYGDVKGVELNDWVSMANGTYNAPSEAMANGQSGPYDTSGMTSAQIDTKLKLQAGALKEQKSQNTMGNWMAAASFALGAKKYADERKRNKKSDARIEAAENRGIERRNKFAMNVGGL